MHVYFSRADENVIRMVVDFKLINLQILTFGFDNIIYFFICACLVIFFYFLQSHWLQQRAAFYDILTVVQKCYFLKTTQGVELIVELE